MADDRCSGVIGQCADAIEITSLYDESDGQCVSESRSVDGEKVLHVLPLYRRVSAGCMPCYTKIQFEHLCRLQFILVSATYCDAWLTTASKNSDNL